jgi:hypothetical protein
MVLRRADAASGRGLRRARLCWCGNVEYNASYCHRGVDDLPAYDTELVKRCRNAKS